MLRASNEELKKQVSLLSERLDTLLTKLEQLPSGSTHAVDTARTHAVQLTNLQSTVNILVEKFES